MNNIPSTRLETIFQINPRKWHTYRPSKCTKKTGMHHFLQNWDLVNSTHFKWTNSKQIPPRPERAKQSPPKTMTNRARILVNWQHGERTVAKQREVPIDDASVKMALSLPDNRNASSVFCFSESVSRPLEIFRFRTSVKNFDYPCFPTQSTKNRCRETREWKSKKDKLVSLYFWKLFPVGNPTCITFSSFYWMSKSKPHRVE